MQSAFIGTSATVTVVVVAFGLFLWRVWQKEQNHKNALCRIEERALACIKPEPESPEVDSPGVLRQFLALHVALREAKKPGQGWNDRIEVRKHCQTLLEELQKSMAMPREPAQQPVEAIAIPKQNG